MTTIEDKYARLTTIKRIEQPETGTLRPMWPTNRLERLDDRIREPAPHDDSPPRRDGQRGVPKLTKEATKRGADSLNVLWQLFGTPWLSTAKRENLVAMVSSTKL